MSALCSLCDRPKGKNRGECGVGLYFFSHTHTVAAEDCRRNFVDWPARCRAAETRLAGAEAEMDRLASDLETARDGNRRGAEVCAQLVAERDVARDEVERLRTRCAELEAHPRWSVHGSSASDIIAERDRLRAEVEALRAERDGWRAVVEMAVAVRQRRLNVQSKLDRHDRYALDDLAVAVDDLLARPTLKATGEPMPSGFVAWPAGEPPRWNACNEPCDMWTGPCCCGATHTEGR